MSAVPFTIKIYNFANYYPFGMQQTGTAGSYDLSSDYRYGYNGKEKDNEIKGEANSLDYGARIYDPRVGRWMSVDPLVRKYPSLSAYNYVANTPLMAIDPDGKDVYLLVWKTKEGESGHAAIAVDNYKMVETKVVESGKEITKTEWIKDGTVTFYDLWPEKPVGNFALQSNVNADYNKRIVDVSDLTKKDVSISGEIGHVSQYGESMTENGFKERPADGVVKITSEYTTDTKVKAKLEAIQKSGASYNGCTNNCSTFAQYGLKILDPKIDASQKITPTGGLSLVYKEANAVAPNNLFNAATKMKGAEIIKGPVKMEAKPYLQYFGK